MTCILLIHLPLILDLYTLDVSSLIMESQNILHDMQKRIRLRFLLVFAVWFGAVCGITAIISLFQGFQRDAALAVFSAAMLIGFFVLVGMPELPHASSVSIRADWKANGAGQDSSCCFAPSVLFCSPRCTASLRKADSLHSTAPQNAFIQQHSLIKMILTCQTSHISLKQPLST